MITNQTKKTCFLCGFLFLALTSLAEGVVMQVDSDFDGKLDQWQHKSEEGRLLKVEYDKNGDGKFLKAI